MTLRRPRNTQVNHCLEQIGTVYPLLQGMNPFLFGYAHINNIENIHEIAFRYG